MWGVVAAAEAAGIKRKLCMEKKVWGSRKGHDRQVSTASVRRSKTQMLGRPTQVFPHVKANSLAAGLQSCTRISATDRMPSPRNSYLPEPLCRQTDRQTDKRVTCLLFFIPCGALSRFLSLFLSFSFAALLDAGSPFFRFFIITINDISSSIQRPQRSTPFRPYYLRQQDSVTLQRQQVSITLGSHGFQLPYKGAGHFHLKLCFGSGLENRFELYCKR